MNVLVLNAGSSSLKFQVIATDLEQIRENRDDRILRGEVEGIGGESILHVQHREEPERTFTAPLRDMGNTLDYVIRYVASDRSGIPEIRSAADIHAVGHRIVHGGELFKESTLIDDRVLKGIEDCIDLAPLHNPNNVKGILAAREIFGKAFGGMDFTARRTVMWPFAIAPCADLRVNRPTSSRSIWETAALPRRSRRESRSTRRWA